MVYLPTWMVFYGKFVGRYSIVPWILWVTSWWLSSSFWKTFVKLDHFPYLGWSEPPKENCFLFFVPDFLRSENSNGSFLPKSRHLKPQIPMKRSLFRGTSFFKDRLPSGWWKHHFQCDVTLSIGNQKTTCYHCTDWFRRVLTMAYDKHHIADDNHHIQLVSIYIIPYKAQTTMVVFTGQCDVQQPRKQLVEMEVPKISIVS